MTSREACKLLDVEPVTLYKYVKSGRIRARPTVPGSRILTFHKDDVARVAKERQGPWTIPYLLIDEDMTHEEVDELVNKIKFFCYSKKYWPLREPSIDVIRESEGMVGFRAMYKFRQILDWAVEHKLERLVLGSSQTLPSDNITYRGFEYLLKKLGNTEIIVADMQMK